MLGVLAVAGGVGVALGLTMLGMHALMSVMPSKRRPDQNGMTGRS